MMAAMHWGSACSECIPHMPGVAIHRPPLTFTTITALFMGTYLVLLLCWLEFWHLSNLILLLILCFVLLAPNSI